MTHISDGLTVGNKRGIGTGGLIKARLATLDYVPPTLDRDGICQAQTRTGAGNLTLNGAFYDSVKGRCAIDAGLGGFGRCLGIYSSGNLSALTFTVYGWDVFGRRLVAAIAGPNNSTVTVPKAYAFVDRVKVSGTVGTNVEVGTVDRFGLPMRVLQAAQVIHCGWSTTLARDAGTLVAGDTTSPATAATTDVRGTYAPSDAANGTKRLVVVISPHMTNRTTQFGVAQYGEGIP